MLCFFFKWFCLFMIGVVFYQQVFVLDPAPTVFASITNPGMGTVGGQ